MVVVQIRLRSCLLVSVLFVIKGNFAASNFYDKKEAEVHTTLNITTCAPDRTSCVSKTRDAKLGADSPKMSAKGWLFALTDSNVSGCNTFKVNVLFQPWIALISRGRCSFEEKIRNAYNHNATAAIVYNDRDGQLQMSHRGSQQIVAVSIDSTLGKELKESLNNGTKVVYVQINVSYEAEDYRLNPASVLFVSVSFIVLMVISLAWLVFYYVQRFRYVHARDKTEKRLTSAAKKAIAKLPTHTLSKKDEDEEIDSCAVCLDGYKAGDVTRILPCRHIFHKACIDPWLVEHRTCPMCKCNILKELGVGPEVTPSHQDVEVGTSELQEQEDHRNAADNPVVALVDVSTSTTQEQRRLSCDEESSGSSSNESGQILCVSAEVNWEPEDHSSSMSNLVPPPSVST